MSKIELKGYKFADGTHWYWGETEVAVINEYTREIEWCVRKYILPEEVILAIRNKRPKTEGQWLIEARHTQLSATQGHVQIDINGDKLISFGDEYELVNGVYQSKTPAEDLGRYVVSAFWHKYDDIYHYSDKAKRMFYPKYKTEMED